MNQGSFIEKRYLALDEFNSHIPFIIVIVLLFLPTLNSMFFGGPLGTPGVLRFIDELAVILMLGYVLIYVISKGRLNSSAWYGINFLIMFFLWGLGLIILNDLPKYHFIQILLTGKLFIFYCYFSQLSNRTKAVYKKCLDKWLVRIFISSLLFSFFLFFAPSIGESILGQSFENRGTFGLALPSFFSSRVAYANFLIIFAVYKLLISRYSRGRVKHKYELLLLASIWLAMLLAGTRKELFFLFFVTIIYFWVNYKKHRLQIIACIALLVTLSAPFILKGFEHANQRALSEEYVRAVIAGHALNITTDYFPLGSGPGTFGSTMSVGYLDVYNKYGVGENILGYNGAERGPIYDMFLISVLAEYGSGSFVLFAFILFLYRQVSIRNNESHLIGNTVGKKLLLFYLIYQSIMTPIMINPAGLFLISIIGISTGGKKFNEQS